MMSCMGEIVMIKIDFFVMIKIIVYCDDQNVEISNSRSPPCLWNENRVSWELARWQRRRPNSERSSRLSTKNRTCQRLSTNIREETTSLTKEPQKLKPMQNGCHIGCCKRVKPINIIEASWKEENKLKMFQEDLRRFSTLANLCYKSTMTGNKSTIGQSRISDKNIPSS